jgi:hypothetical protein
MAGLRRPSSFLSHLSYSLLGPARHTIQEDVLSQSCRLTATPKYLRARPSARERIGSSTFVPKNRSRRPCSPEVDCFPGCPFSFVAGRVWRVSFWKVQD